MKRKSSETFESDSRTQKSRHQEQQPHLEQKQARRNSPLESTSKEQKCVFDVMPIDRFDHAWPFYRKPVEVGGFSLDENRAFHNNRRKLKEYKQPLSDTLNFDLRLGYGSFVSRNEEIPERLDHLLKWINLHKDKFRLPGVTNDNGSLNTDFITWRGHLVKILCTPYETKEPWQMDACNFNGTIYISEVETEVRKMQRRSESQRQKEMCYWGYKFEDYMTKSSGDPAASNSSSGMNCRKDSLNNSECFCSVIRSRLNKYSIVIGAEVDCWSSIDGTEKPPDSYVELKTSRIMANYGQIRSFSRFKLKKFWAQSYLAGVPKVVCGMRDDNGIVRKIEDYKTLDIPKIANSNDGGWNAAICMNFCDVFLQWVKETVVEDDFSIVYSFRFDKPFNAITVERQAIGAKFLPDWFTQGLLATKND